ncbi:hypothetical protein CEH05_16555 [Halobacillus halophilus]|uniref:Group-specific protein n=1 Tax=Halobacillus halophilus (strain ATCC 35676 / DSM 2266 / JCM 20832 / KCTC 3685 / LMG 17431 / NBRC 102448 / NCIMB 2269) TaxID=866895 RepID=I0JRC2_HALH3|nr:hypothetical protein [Halobacillus halophilus]ASF40676.1 hypothetical protein CEH05_16555 [Halobacillus halophilus]CCG46692.1 hypothetical protein HBHAL_4351 [Halobacillus halophilus DSM 2266]
MSLFLTNLVVPFIWLAVVGWLSGSKDFIFKPKEDERKEWIKQKAVVQSWATLILFLLSNFLFDFFNVGDPRLEGFKMQYPELFYLAILLVSYIIFYIMNGRKVSA